MGIRRTLWLACLLASALATCQAADGPEAAEGTAKPAIRYELKIDAPTRAVADEILVAKPAEPPASGSLAVWTVIHRVPGIDEEWLLDETEYEVDESDALVIRRLEPGTYTLVLVVMQSDRREYGVGMAVVRVEPYEAQQKGSVRPGNALNGPLNATLSETSDPTPVMDDEPPQRGGAAIIAEASTAFISPLLLVVPLLMILTAAAWGLWLAPEVVTQDSAEFTRALSIWHGVIATKCSTPRAFKRYMNRLRFLAMRKGALDTEPTHWLAVRNWLRRLANVPIVEPPVPVERGPIDEPLLVALCGIHLLDPRWIQHDALWKRLAEGLKGAVAPQGQSNETYSLLKEAIAEHQHVFETTWQLDEVQRQALFELFSQIRG